LFSRFSTRAAQEAQVMPPISSSTWPPPSVTDRVACMLLELMASLSY
jgi:hypothetical protein